MEGEAPGPEETGNQVTLMTLHKAKGLEFPVVILSGAAPEKSRAPEFIVNRQKGSVQFKSGSQELKLFTAGFESAKAEEEEQEKAEALRLLYVGCTRARESLVLPLFSQEKGGGFLKPITASFDEKVFEKRKVTASSKATQAGALAVDLHEKDRSSALVQDQKAWFQTKLDEKKALVEKRKGKTRLASVTSLVHSDDDKQLREGYQLEGERTSGEGQAIGKAFGVLTHQLLEKGWNWDQKTLSQAALYWAPELGLPAEKAQEAAQLATRALARELLQRAKKSPKIFRELSLTGGASNGKQLNAVIDLAFLEEDQWVIVDYKTDQDPSRGVEAYRQQLGHYQDLLEKLTDKKVKAKYLYFLREESGGVIEV
jgi:ATP-dependent exoDNAse (exonuclease V) beta subunit